MLVTLVIPNANEEVKHGVDRGILLALKLQKNKSTNQELRFCHYPAQFTG